MSPNEKWNRAIAQQLPPEKFSERDLDQLLREVHRRSICGGRVTLFGLQWTGPGLAEMERRLRPGQKAIIYVNKCNLGEVYVTLPERTEEVFRATGALPSYQNNLTLYEHMLVDQWMTQHKEKLTAKIAISALYEIRLELMAVADEFASRKKNKTKNKAITNANTALTLDKNRHQEAYNIDELNVIDNNTYETFYTPKLE